MCRLLKKIFAFVVFSVFSTCVGWSCEISYNLAQFGLTQLKLITYKRIYGHLNYGEKKT